MLQSIIILAVFQAERVFPQMDETACTSFAENVGYRGSTLRTNMDVWSNLQAVSNQMDLNYRQFLSDRGIDEAGFASSAEQQKQFLSNSADELVRTLRKNQVNGVFLILTDTAARELPDTDRSCTRQGLCIRDLDQTSSYIGTEDLLVERGPASVVSRLGYALDSWWRASYQFTGSQEGEYYYAPIEAALKNPRLDESKLGFWCPLHQISGLDESVISYSIPLLSHGTVYGVLGVEVTRSYLASFLPDGELGDNGAYWLAVQGEEGTYTLMGSQQDSAARLLGSGRDLTLGDELYDGCFNASTEESGKLAVDVEPLSMYQSRKLQLDYSNDSLVLIGATPKSDLFAMSRQMHTWVLLAALLSLLAGIAGSMGIAHVVVKPIDRLSRRIKDADAGHSVELENIGIAEVDQLISSINQLNSSVAENQNKLSAILRMINYPLGVFEVDSARNSVYISDGFFSVLKGVFTPAEERNMRNPIVFQNAMERLYGCEKDAESESSVVYGIAALVDSERWVRVRTAENGTVQIGVVLDATAEILRKRKIELERDYDVLTGLYNRSAFQARLRNLFDAPDRLGIAAMVMIDIDHLKTINDKYGHDFGDRYICCAADFLRSRESERTLVAHISGDEFAVFLYGATSRDEIRELVKIIMSGAEKTELSLPDGGSKKLQMSAGMAWYPDDSREIRMLLRYADYAMYQVKQSGRGTVREFDFSGYYHDNLVEYRQELAGLLREERLDYALQPIIDLHTGAAAGYEAEMRPRSAILRTPAEVITLARAQGALYQLEQVSWKQALKKLSESFCEDDGYRLFLHSVPDQLLSPEDYRAVFTGFESVLRRAVLEITPEEYAGEGRSVEKLRTFMEYGTQLAIVCSDAEMELKIDGQVRPALLLIGIDLVRGVDQDEKRQAALKLLVDLARENGLQTAAQGIDTWEELQYLRTAGVNLGQGYLIREPQDQPGGPSERFLGRLRRLEN